jgi:hypothetical protein
MVIYLGSWATAGSRLVNADTHTSFIALSTLQVSHTACDRSPPLLRVDRILFERVKIDLFESAFVRSLHLHLGHTLLRYLASFEGIKSFQPSSCTKTPFASFGEPCDPQIIPLRGAVVQELFCHYTGHSMISIVSRAASAVAISIVACHRFCAEEGQGLLEDCEVH